MLRTMCNGKIHRVKVTGANINYVGSITIDPVLMQAAGILPYERVQVVNLNNGARFETYTMEGKPDSGEIVVNGAAARLVSTGDIVIIMSYVLMNEEECVGHKPRIAFVDEFNRLKG
jgi:aspartate 1-decarboxylase